ncbi:hypothetical protein KDAU_48440 [Dictyobacter aurantiacus]|uniref:Uncharacterized protein n=1 Tax=Dictyobacter aurantiacus TaxID=1936993 RepID=A0A401ZKY6_9CHLR|nr:hypothetical protein KDAU_48440 [Dictyobacter aurantiacus]
MREAGGHPLTPARGLAGPLGPRCVLIASLYIVARVIKVYTISWCVSYINWFLWAEWGCK